MWLTTFFPCNFGKVEISMEINMPSNQQLIDEYPIYFILAKVHISWQVMWYTCLSDFVCAFSE